MSDLVNEIRGRFPVRELDWESRLIHDAADTIAEIEKLHYARSVETHHGTYEICDYDKTLWPCRTHKILNPEEG